jgi:putative holliday junction resolvase
MSSAESENKHRAAPQKILAVDYGTKAAGLALFSPGHDPYPLPYARIGNKSDKALLLELLRVVREESVTVVVLGVPRLLDGTETTMTRRIAAFGEKLEAALKPVPLFRQDESLSSFEAEERMKNSARYNFRIDPSQIDALAAAIILEDFMEQQEGKRPAPDSL